MKVRQKRRKCPKCGKYYVGYPALSREDNKTEICPECGVKEALTIFLDQTQKHGRLFAYNRHLIFVIQISTLLRAAQFL